MAVEIIEQLEHKRETALQLIEAITQRAADEGRELSDEDRTSIDESNVKVRAWNADLDRVTMDRALAEDTARRLRGIGTLGVVGNDFRYRSDGELLWDVLHPADPDAKTRFGRVMRRAAEHMGTLIADTTATAGDMAGLIVKPVVGAVINPYPSGMPLASAIGLRPVPASDGFGFSRPQVVDANFATGVGTQALEKAELASKAFSVTSTAVSLDTVGGYLNLSQQLLSFAPQSLQIVIDQMRRRLEAAIEKYIYAEFDNTTGKVTLSLTAAADVVLKAIYDAAAAYYGVTQMLPSLLVVGPTGWARLGSLVDAAGRPLFPTIGAANAPGTANATTFNGSVAGLNLVVTPAITDGKMFVTGTEGIEGYMYTFPVLETVEASLLGRQVAVAAAVAAYRPTPFANATQLLGP
jgi:HK97 family phage major capsid protein